jgi:hypothetical protein
VAPTPRSKEASSSKEASLAGAAGVGLITNIRSLFINKLSSTLPPLLGSAVAATTVATTGKTTSEDISENKPNCTNPNDASIHTSPVTPPRDMKYLQI